MTEINKVSEIFEKESPLFLQFKRLRTILYENPAIFRDETSPNLGEAQALVKRISSGVGLEIYRGQDFNKSSQLTQEQAIWLRRQTVLNPDSHPVQSKQGRLAHIVAMHPRRDEIFPRVSREFIESNDNSKALPHVARLLTHCDGRVCEEFALDVMGNSSTLSRIPESYDGNCSFIFWTYGPYILNGIKQIGFKYTDLIERWAACRVEEETSNVNARYPGMEHMFTGRVSKFAFLTKSEKDPSHLFTSFISQLVVVPQVFKKK